VSCRLREDGEKHGKEDRLIPVPPLTEDTLELTKIDKDEDVEGLAIAKKTRTMGARFTARILNTSSRTTKATKRVSESQSYRR